MNRLSLALVVVAPVVAVVSTASVGLAQGSAVASQSDAGALVLRNGSLLQGEITQTGDGFDVVVEGGRIHVKAGDVEFHCRTLEEGYQRKRALIQPGDLREHLDLAQWCQRYGLLELAAEELARARALDPTHPLIPLVERRIKMSLCRPQPAERPAERVDPAPSPEDLERSVREMPPGSVEEFTKTIQPLLVNRCSAAGCHGPGSDHEFRLLRIPSARPASRRLTQRNLHGTLAWIDRDDPARSKLLTVPIQPHGSAEAIFADHDRDQYQRIVNWVYQVAGPASPINPIAAEPKQELPPHVRPPWLAKSAAHTAPVTPPTDDPANVVPAVPLPNGSSSSSRAKAGAVGFGRGGNPLINGPMVAGGTGLPQVAPVDPFDPEIFNRRFFPEQRTSAQITPDAWQQFVEEGRQAGDADRVPSEASTGDPASPSRPIK
ncbi:MAG TPA: hypothetical protein VMY37_39585 [Thermoguttaceae bacterium]|nr:hypothetical protein [Thermoguttaceae bacterium]